jgi:ATP-dependent DNA helicase DinG
MDYGSAVQSAIGTYKQLVDVNPELVLSDANKALLKSVAGVLVSEKPILVAEADKDARCLAYLVSALVVSREYSKRVVITTSNVYEVQSLVDTLQELVRVFPFSFDFTVVDEYLSFNDGAEVIVCTHHQLAESELIGKRVLPSPSEAIYVFDEAHRLDSALCDTAAFSFSLLPIVEFLQKLSVDTQKEELAIIDVMSWIKDKHGSMFRGRREYMCNGGTISPELAGLIDRAQFLLSKFAMSNEEGFSLVKEANRLKGFLTYSESSIQAKWIVFNEIEDYEFHSKPIMCAGMLRDMFGYEHSGVIFTSSVLQTVDTVAPRGMSFETFLTNIGLNGAPVEVNSFKEVSGVEHQMIVPEVPFDANSNSEEYKQWIGYNIFPYLKDHTSSVVLFNSVGVMEYVRGVIESSCTNYNILIQCEGDNDLDVIASNHLKAQRIGYSSVVFGLSGLMDRIPKLGPVHNLVFTRLPFGNQNEPAVKARSDFDYSNGTLPFYSYTLPCAAMEMALAINSLSSAVEEPLRCVVFDRRITDSSYGENIIKALPPMKINIKDSQYG